MQMKQLIDKLYREQTLTREEWIHLLDHRTDALAEYVFSLAR